MNKLILGVVLFAIVAIVSFVLFYPRKLLKVGDTPPQFELPDQNGVPQKLSDYKGQYVVLYFYPSDDTPGCTKQACSLRDNFTVFTDKNIKVFGINYNSVASHKAFIEKYHLPFTLLSDGNKKTAEAYGAQSAVIVVPQRITFIITPEQKICAVLKDVDVQTHTQDVLDIIEQDQKK